MSKKKKKDDGLKGALILENADVHKCRFRIEDIDKLTSNRVVDFDRDLLPPDYEPDRYDVSGEISVNIKVKKK